MQGDSYRGSLVGMSEPRTMYARLSNVAIDETEADTSNNKSSNTEERLDCGVCAGVNHLVRDCLPVPPTPTSRALPRSCRTMRAMRDTCSIASMKKTSFISFDDDML